MKHRVVRIAQFAFDPEELTVAPGDTVEWLNADILPHTTTADSGAWASPEFAPAGRFRWIATRPGRYPYHCAAHPAMTALLIVAP